MTLDPAFLSSKLAQIVRLLIPWTVPFVKFAPTVSTRDPLALGTSCTSLSNGIHGDELPAFGMVAVPLDWRRMFHGSLLKSFVNLRREKTFAGLRLYGLLTAHRRKRSAVHCDCDHLFGALVAVFVGAGKSNHPGLWHICDTDYASRCIRHVS